MGTFMSAMKQTMNDDFNESITENGAVGYRTTGKNLLDLNFAVASLRTSSDENIAKMFSKAFFEDKVTAMKWLFFARDVRGGLGERKLFRVVVKYMATEHPEYIKPLVSLIPEYGRWDDLWCMLDVPALKDEVSELVQIQLENDIRDSVENKNISLLAKWMPRCKASSKLTRKHGDILREYLHMTERQYQHTLAGLSLAILKS